MKPSLIPRTFSDRLSVAMSPVFLAISLAEFADQNPLWGGAFLCLGIAFLVNAYVLQDPPPATARSHAYAQYVERLQSASVQLRGVADFLVEEQSHLQASERAIAALQQEHATLEPIVRTERQTIEDLLKAQQSFAARKERFIGFGIGIVASVVAAFVYARLPWQ